MLCGAVSLDQLLHLASTPADAYSRHEFGKLGNAKIQALYRAWWRQDGLEPSPCRGRNGLTALQSTAKSRIAILRGTPNDCSRQAEHELARRDTA
jgi:hypothetical protein